MALELDERPFLFRLARIGLPSACVLRTGVRLNSKVMVNVFVDGNFKTGAFRLARSYSSEFFIQVYKERRQKQA